jgi:hypothetical protein
MSGRRYQGDRQGRDWRVKGDLAAWLVTTRFRPVSRAISSNVGEMRIVLDYQHYRVAGHNHLAVVGTSSGRPLAHGERRQAECVGQFGGALERSS